MDPIGPIRAWHYLAVGNIVPAPSDRRILASCALCRGETAIDPRGSLYTAPENCEVVCDRCGEREAPEAMALVRQLRATRELTVAVAGASLDQDAWAAMCPLCQREQMPDELPDEGSWHVVDAIHGRPVCAECRATVNPALQELQAALERREAHSQVFKAIPPTVH